MSTSACLTARKGRSWILWDRSSTPISLLIWTFLPWTIPPWMDFAVRARDTKGASSSSVIVLSVIDEVPAGYVSSRTVEPGTAIRIMTGAAIPSGTDTVVSFEDTDEDARTARGDGLSQIGILVEGEQRRYTLGYGGCRHYLHFLFRQRGHLARREKDVRIVRQEQDLLGRN